MNVLLGWSRFVELDVLSYFVSIVGKSNLFIRSTLCSFCIDNAVLTLSIKLKSKEVIRIKGVKLQFKNGDILLGLIFVQYRVRRLAEKNVYVLSEMTYFVSSWT